MLLHHPYESFDPVVAFVGQAAEDPDVLAIKQTLYRTSGDSPIVRALARAAENGKQVTVLVELKARFDEQSNIHWARAAGGGRLPRDLRHPRLQDPRQDLPRRAPRQRAASAATSTSGTGNYNDRTARLYTDFGLMTSDREIGADASAFFNCSRATPTRRA